MSLTINTNLSSTTAQDNLAASSLRIQESLRRLATGSKLGSSTDDPATAVLAALQAADITGLKVAITNIERSISLIQTAEGGAAEISNLLLTLRQLAVESANSGTLDADALAANQAEIAAVLGSIDRIADTTQFGRVKLLSADSEVVFQIGGVSGEVAKFTLQNLHTTEMAAGDSNATTNLSKITGKVIDTDNPSNFTSLNAIDVSTTQKAQDAVKLIDVAINEIGLYRSQLGSLQKHTLEASKKSLGTQLQNMQVAQSVLVDVDYAAEIANFTSEQIKQQAAQAVMGIANQQQQSILGLLGRAA